VGEDLADKTDDLCEVWDAEQGWPQGIATYTFAVDPYGVAWLGSGGGLGAYDPWCGSWHATNVGLGSVWEVEVGPTAGSGGLRRGAVHPGGPRGRVG